MNVTIVLKSFLSGLNANQGLIGFLGLIVASLAFMLALMIAL